uniref:L1 transposable element RRM domain-containing protein n=1 Tax=Salarias fasciatus TaxID=181472 RepID=A0A672FSR4_SALFA
MPSKGQKAAEREEASGASANLSMDAISALLEKHRKSLATDFKTSLTRLEAKFDQHKLMIDDHDQRISSLELLADDVSQRVSELEDAISSLRDDNTKLKAKVSELEDRGRRSNLRVLGLADSTESGRLTEFFAALLQDVFGKDTLPSPPEIDRAHRIGAVRPAPGARPQPVIMRLHRYQIKEQLIREARRKGTLDYRGKKIRIVEDYSAEVMSQRARYRDVMVELYRRGLKPALLYPARLRLTLPSRAKKWINSVEEAQQVIENHTS